MMTKTQPYLRLILGGAHDGQFNMAVDEFLFRRQIESCDQDSILRFYRFSHPTVTVGYGMWQALQTKTKAIRRITGGGIVSHTPMDLTYSFITPINHASLQKVRDSYWLIHSILKKSFARLNIHAELYPVCDKTSESEKISHCFTSPVMHDLMLNNHKIAGAGQKRSKGYLLHQGSIAWNFAVQENPNLSEIEFAQTFAEFLASEFNQSIHETSLNSCEVKLLETANG